MTDHAELIAEARKLAVDDRASYGGDNVFTTTLDSLCDALAALAKERDAVVAECTDSIAIAGRAITRAEQAERERDEALRLLADDDHVLSIMRENLRATTSLALGHKEIMIMSDARVRHIARQPKGS